MLTRLDPSAEVSADPPGLAAAEGPQRAVQGEVAQPDRLEVAQPGLHLIEHHPADLALPVGQVQRAKESGRVADLQGADFAGCLPPIRAARASGRSRVPPQAGQGR